MNRTLWLLAFLLPVYLVATLRAEVGTDKNRLTSIESLHLALQQADVSQDLLSVMRVADMPAITSISSQDQMLQAIAKHFGAHVLAVDNLSLTELRHSSYPVLIRIKPAMEAPIEDEIYAFIEPKGENELILYAGPMTTQLRWQDIAKLWSGHILAISREPVNESRLHYRQTYQSAAYWGIGGLSIVGACLTAFRRRRKHLLAKSHQTVRDIGCMAIGAFVLAVITYWAYGADAISEQVALIQDDGRRHIDLRNTAHPVVDVTFQNIDQAFLETLLSKQPLFIDARDTDDFNKSHIRGAICLSAFNETTIRLELAGIPYNTPLVVYCVNKHCGLGRAAARALVQTGYTNVYHFVNGWEELSGLSVVQKEKSAATLNPAAKTKPDNTGLPF